ncbi:MAG: M20/M25/M40 family metallo-hydrolase [Chloroflexia bacterium]
MLTALGVVEELHARGERLPCAIEVLGFADEEGLRYQTSYLGSLSALGQARPTGSTAPMRTASPCATPSAPMAATPTPSPPGGHRSRGGATICSAIANSTSSRVRCWRRRMRRSASSAPSRAAAAARPPSPASPSTPGTVPGHLRRDALCAAAEFVLAVEGAMRDTPALSPRSGASSPNQARSTSSPAAPSPASMCAIDNATRAAAAARLRAQAAQDRRRARARPRLGRPPRTPRRRLLPRLVGLLEAAIAAHNLPVHTLPSGAGHDPVALSRLTDVAMLFLRCKGGISHNPAESVTVGDVADETGGSP